MFISVEPNWFSWLWILSALTFAFKETVERRFFSVKDSAMYSSLSYWTVRDLCALKQLPHIRVGKRILIEKKDLDDFLLSRKESAL